MKTRRIALRELLQRGIDNPIELAKELKVTVQTIKRDLEAIKTMSEEDFTFQKETLPKRYLIKKMKY